MVRYCLERADADGLPTYLIAFPKAKSLYARCGFEVVEYVDFDLSKWTTEFSGYGIYRNYGMLRQPVTQVKELDTDLDGN